MMLLSLMPANVDDGDDGHDHVDGDYGTGDVGGCGWQSTASVCQSTDCGVQLESHSITTRLQLYAH